MDRVLHVFRDPALDGPTNMARDDHLLHSDTLRPASIRIYAWQPPTISLGCFQRHAEVARLPEDVRGLAVVRRVTGGGAILHDREVTYGLVLDASFPVARESPVALYRLVHECWRAALVAGGVHSALAPDSYPMPTPRTGPFFCFQKPGRTDLVMGGQKLLGSAQRRMAGRVLQHGSLLLGQGFPSHPGADLGNPSAAAVGGWVDGFLTRLAVALEVDIRRETWTEVQLREVADRRVRFDDAAWTRRR